MAESDQLADERLATQLIDRLFGLTARLHAELAAAVSEQGLTGQQAVLIWALGADRKPPQMRELAGIFHCDPSSITSLVGRLERNGLVERRSSADDQRVREVHLTAAGRRIRRRLTRAATSTPLDRLSPNQRRQLLGLLTRTADSENS